SCVTSSASRSRRRRRRWTFPSARPSAIGPTPAPGSIARLPDARTELAQGRKFDGPFLPEIPHERVTANNGRGELAMKNWNKYAGSRDTAKTLVRVLATSSGALGTAPSATTFSRRRLLARLGLFTATIAAAPALAAQPPRPRCDKGADQLM